ncbi:CDC50/LEM3 family, partial [Dillenia turbinata]
VITAFTTVGIIFISIGIVSLSASNDFFWIWGLGYLKSRNDQQLRSKNSASNTDGSKPEAEANGQPIVPCGLIAWSLFNDTYSFSLQKNNAQLAVNKKEISRKSDRDHKFGKDVYPKNFQKGSLIGGVSHNESIPLSKQEDLIVWMRTAALPTFRSCMLGLSTTTWLGGKNDFLGIAYIAVGRLCLFLALSFTAIYLV